MALDSPLRGKRAGEATQAGASGLAVAELLRTLRWWGSLIILAGAAAVLTGTDLDPVWDALDRLAVPLAAAGGVGGIAAALSRLREKPVAANTEIASVETERKVDGLALQFAAVAQDVTGLKGALQDALAEIVQFTTPAPSSGHRQDTGVQAAVEPTLREDGHLQLYATAIRPDPAAIALPDDVQARARATWEQIQYGYDAQQRST